MFLQKIIKRNPKLIEIAFKLHRDGIIRPDSYIIDMDSLISNAKKIKTCADKYGIKLYFMLKQIGRNPYIAKKLIDLDYEGATAVDFKEAQIYLDNNIKLGNVGHLVQIPDGCLERIIKNRPDVITVYSESKILKINEICDKLSLKQELLLRITEDGDILYKGQETGFSIDEALQIFEKCENLKNVSITGITSFPCMLYNEKSGEIEITQNFKTILKTAERLKNCGCDIKQINAPSSNCCSSLPKLSALGANYAEPGHSLTGTTPLHAVKDEPEMPSIIYLSEISHNFRGNAYCYGGGYYRRSYVKNAIVGDAISYKTSDIIEPDSQSIDYHFSLKGSHKIGDSVIMSFRTQIFTTRSDIVLIENLHNNGNVKIAGIFDGLGRKL